ncbi:MarR family transcriptional regulator [Nocardia sp. CDC159]|uniref:MarR family transcriptional regulator n=1 Tax=Nocardia pulmonis TaxID=2951408 RepID=A0A9X2E9W8_9NOCA|nr:MULTISPECIES: MarR family transcriptional regulator [Nocardia]MCM6776807.1 MarR family transcriptional regulator [Nocardia pulmonis]MCM6789044.1 MarR family transcriptional regulator [Nocardia sp. CDC159]
MTESKRDRKALVGELTRIAVPAWAIRVVQLNGLVAARLGVTDTDVQCLHVLDRYGPATPGALAERVNLTTGSASRMIDRLVAADCVRRVPDPTDRRRVLIEPTRTGIDRAAAAYAGLGARTEADLEGFDDEEIRTILRFLEAAERSTAEEIRRLRSGS